MEFENHEENNLSEKFNIYKEHVDNGTLDPFTLPQLNKHETIEMSKKLEDGESEYHPFMFYSYMRLIPKIAKKYHNIHNSYEFRDLMQQGCTGLLQAINTYDYKHNTDFVTYAYPCIRNEIHKFVKKNTNQNHSELTEDIGTQGDIVFEKYEAKERNERLREAVDKLDELEKEIISLIYGLDEKEPMTQEEIAKTVGLNQKQISRIKNRVIKKLSKEKTVVDF